MVGITYCVLEVTYCQFWKSTFLKYWEFYILDILKISIQVLIINGSSNAILRKNNIKFK